MHIQDDRPDDTIAIYDLTGAALKGLPYGAVDKQGLVNALSDDGAVIPKRWARITPSSAHGCVPLGYPAHCCRFGIQHDPWLIYSEAANPSFQPLTFKGKMPKGNVVCHPALTRAG